MNDSTEALLKAQRLGLPTPQTPTELKDVNARRYLQEQVFSTFKKVLSTFNFQPSYNSHLLYDFALGKDTENDNIVEIADATGDTIVVTKGSQATFGFAEEYGEEQYDMIAVKFFMASMEQTVRDIPVLHVTNQEYDLRGTLIAEELLELLVQGFRLDVEGILQDGTTVNIENLKLFSTSLQGERYNALDDDKAEQALRDLFAEVNILVKLIDIVYGIPTDDVFREIMRSNMNKLWEDGKPRFREGDRKIIKPPNWTEPDIKKVLENAII